MFTTNDCAEVEFASISTFTTITVPAVTRIVVGLPMRSKQHSETPAVSTVAVVATRRAGQREKQNGAAAVESKHKCPRAAFRVIAERGLEAC